ncbi:hypothetical protein ACFWIJ_42950, partial [Streptomyces sp. NPDC127079]|uniref:hypothetical protein n=1 Tax=Streptomyces sp. NPDC127079 TaxID=3347132 RepID=UPI003660B10A
PPRGPPPAPAPGGGARAPRSRGAPARPPAPRGALLALTDSGSPLRAPLVLLFLIAAPAAAIALGLGGLDPFARALTALAGAVALDMLVAQGMLATHRWSWRGGIVAVAVISLLLLLLVRLRPVERILKRVRKFRSSK